MSFAYMPIYTGDYLRDTRHLTPLKHGIYLLALMHCWDSKGPMPLDEQECAGVCNCRSADEIDAMRYIINRYFVRMDDGNYNKRMADEVAKAERQSMAYRDAGLRSAEARREKARAGHAAKSEQRLNQGSTEVKPRLVSPSPSLHQEKEKNTRASRTSPVHKPESVSAQVWNDWLAQRKASRATVTETALAGIKREAGKAGLSLQDALAMSCERGWRGFKAEWIKVAAPVDNVFGGAR